MGKIWIASILATARIYGAAICDMADTRCQEPVAVGGGGSLMVYRSAPLTARDEAIERVFILVHGVGRDGNVYFRSAIEATRDAGRLESTLVIAPQFHANDGARCKDATVEGESLFSCRGWSDGTTTAQAALSSFTAMDGLLTLMANRERFPKLKEIVLAGHSAGGQFVQRYAAVNRVDGKLAVPVRYVVANPSSYLYLEAWRPVASVAGACAGFDKYKFGLQGLVGYAAGTSAATIKATYPKRDVTYLLGELDVTDEHSMDKTCPAMAQGPNRFERGTAYVGRLREKFAASHRMLTVPGCAHSGECMYRSPVGRRVVFGE